MVRSPLINVLGVGLTAFVCKSAAFAQTAIDGDTISVGGKTYDLWGIDAPEPEQQCGSWLAGREAAEHLKEFISGKVVVCTPKGVDKFGATLARCTADKTDIGEAKVRDGYAWAFEDYTTDYVDEERQAFESNLGIHRHNCERPWEYRERAKAKGKAR